MERTKISSGLFAAALWSVGVLLLATPGEAATQCPGYTRCPEVNFASVMSQDEDALRIAREIAAGEKAGLAASLKPDLTTTEARAVLGQILVFDRNLSVDRNQACFSCHDPASGFTGGISLLNVSTGSMPGSVRMRTGNRTPKSAGYAAFAPVLHYDAQAGDFIGGNFWDSRATGLVTGSPSADQAMGPPTNPLEMAMPDRACVIRRISQSSYAAFFRKVWGANAFAVSWPADTDAVCAKPNQGAPDQRPVKLTASDRKRVEASYVAMAKSIAAFERSKAVSPFSSKFDAVLARKAVLTAQEAAGFDLFKGKAKCNECHPSEGRKPLFTDFTAVNLGIPKNRDNPFFHENANDGKGLVANPAGPAYVDDGLGAVLAGAGNPRPEWAALAPDFVGAFQVASLRNVARTPRPGFSRAYMHNGWFNDLKTVVHFYNTRDVLPSCRANNTTGVGVTCWPAPAQAANLNHGETGKLGLTDAEEDAVVAFLATLTDGYFDPSK